METFQVKCFIDHLLIMVWSTIGLGKDLPIIVVLNGFDCESSDYSHLLNNLALKGYLSVVTDLRHNGRSKLPLPPPGTLCPHQNKVAQSFYHGPDYFMTLQVLAVPKIATWFRLHLF